MNEKRLFFETEVEDPGCQATAYRGGDQLRISNNDDWCGDTETGFGATVSVGLTREDATRLRDMIDTWLES